MVQNRNFSSPDHDSIKQKLSIRFPQTPWTMIEDPVLMDQVNKLIAEKYWEPLHFFLTRKGCNIDDADEILQRFFLQRILLSERLIKKADRTKGKFRSYLIKVLRDETSDYYKEKGKHLPSLPEGHDISQEDEPFFTKIWSIQILNKVIDMVKAELISDGRVNHWNVFNEMVLQPAMNHPKPSRYCIRHKYNLIDDAQVSNMAQTVKRRYRKALESLIGRSVDSINDVEEEINDIFQILSKNSARKN